MDDMFGFAGGDKSLGSPKLEDDSDEEDESEEESESDDDI